MNDTGHPSAREEAEQLFDRYGSETIERVRAAILASMARHGPGATCWCYAFAALKAIGDDGPMPTPEERESAMPDPRPLFPRQPEHWPERHTYAVRLYRPDGTHLHTWPREAPPPNHDDRVKLPGGTYRVISRTWDLTRDDLAFLEVVLDEQ